MSDTTPVRRHGRFWLYAPFVLLALLAAGWSGIWGFARSKVDQELDAGLAREVRAGRNWTCRDRNVGGYPFRIEVRCASLTLTSSRWGDEVKLDAGPGRRWGSRRAPAATRRRGCPAGVVLLEADVDRPKRASRGAVPEQGCSLRHAFREWGPGHRAERLGAGVVDAVGEGETGLEVGDAAVGLGDGGLGQGDELVDRGGRAAEVVDVGARCR